MPGVVGPALVPQEAEDEGKRDPCEPLSSPWGSDLPFGAPLRGRWSRQTWTTPYLHPTAI